ncbi:unnamed protein product [Amoebophrya sp. A120]|nr:unnamed protein product [Amoebophrya sp. A120]|eukprot:GSA120T00020704001.1
MKISSSALNEEQVPLSKPKISLQSPLGTRSSIKPERNFDCRFSFF